MLLKAKKLIFGKSMIMCLLGFPCKCDLCSTFFLAKGFLESYSYDFVDK